MLVSALMITGKTRHHRRFALRAIEQFHQQTFPAANRELVIINTDDSYWFKGVLPANAREYLVEPATLGELRNTSMDYADGDLLWQFDDDDYRAPDCLAQQVAHFEPGALNMLRKQYRLNLLSNLWGIIDAHKWLLKGIPGTVLYARCEHRYPALVKAEDAKFARKFSRMHVWDNPPELYCYMYHGKNTWEGNTHAAHSNPHKPENMVGDAAFMERVISSYAGLCNHIEF